MFDRDSLFSKFTFRLISFLSSSFETFQRKILKDLVILYPFSLLIYAKIDGYVLKKESYRFLLNTFKQTDKNAA